MANEGEKELVLVCFHWAAEDEDLMVFDCRFVIEREDLSNIFQRVRPPHITLCAQQYNYTFTLEEMEDFLKVSGHECAKAFLFAFHEMTDPHLRDWCGTLDLRRVLMDAAHAHLKRIAANAT